MWAPKRRIKPSLQQQKIWRRARSGRATTSIKDALSQVERLEVKVPAPQSSQLPCRHPGQSPTAKAFAVSHVSKRKLKRKYAKAYRDAQKTGAVGLRSPKSKGSNQQCRTGRCCPGQNNKDFCDCRRRGPVIYPSVFLLSSCSVTMEGAMGAVLAPPILRRSGHFAGGGRLHRAGAAVGTPDGPYRKRISGYDEYRYDVDTII